MIVAFLHRGVVVVVVVVMMMTRTTTFLLLLRLVFGTNTPHASPDRTGCTILLNTKDRLFGTILPMSKNRRWYIHIIMVTLVRN